MEYRGWDSPNSWLDIFSLPIMEGNTSVSIESSMKLVKNIGRAVDLLPSEGYQSVAILSAFARETCRTRSTHDAHRTSKKS